MGGPIVHALRGIDLKVLAGEYLGIIGPSGSGKSTLLQVLGCLERPTSGLYRLNGTDVSALSDTELSRIRATQIGFVFQTFNLIPQCTVRENVAMPFFYQPNPPTDAERLVERAIERVGLRDRGHHLPAQVSGGERQRAAIARAIVVNPAVLLADEPTGNLDSRTGADILLLFSTLNEAGTTIVMVTHSREASQCCHRVLRLTDGLIAGQEEMRS